MKIIFTNISPITKSYTNINHIYYLKKQKPQKVYLCVWDNFVFEHPIFDKSVSSSANKIERLKENVLILEKLMSFLKIDYKIIYLSEATNRLFKNPAYLKEFHDILSSIKIEDLNKGLGIEYVPFSKISLSRIHYIITDYLVATYLPELFPELCSSAPNYYLTSERFSTFKDSIDHTLKNNFTKHFPPKTVYVQKVPVILHPEKEIIPSLEMSIESIKNIVSAHYAKKPEIKEFNDLLDVFSNVLDGFVFNNKKFSKEEIIISYNQIKKEDFVEFISYCFYNYFSKVSGITSKIDVTEQKKNLFISQIKDFNKTIKPLNEIKLIILKNCDGSNSSLDISKKTGIKLSTVSTYLTHMKNKGLVDNSKRPRRLVDSFVIDLEVIQND